jgi:hypothetical protein
LSIKNGILALTFSFFSWSAFALEPCTLQPKNGKVKLEHDLDLYCSDIIIPDGTTIETQGYQLHLEAENNVVGNDIKVVSYTGEKPQLINGGDAQEIRIEAVNIIGKWSFENNGYKNGAGGPVIIRAYLGKFKADISTCGIGQGVNSELYLFRPGGSKIEYPEGCHYAINGA